MLFAIDIGNSNIHIGFFDKDELIHTFCLGSDKNRTSDEYALLLKSVSELNGYTMNSFDSAIIGSVVPAVTPIIQRALEAILKVTPIIVGPGVKTGFPIKIDDPSELGADLAANAAGAIAKVGCPAIVIDFGTATTISVIDETRAYIGAAIMPGVQMSLDSLQNTGLLPGIAADKTVPIIGKTTKDCMSAGVLRGQAFAAQSFAKAYREAYFSQTSSNLIISGGFAEVMRPYILEKFTYIPYLTLEGLNVIYKNHKVNPRKK